MVHKHFLLIIIVFFTTQFYGQEFVESKEFELTKYDSKLFEKLFAPNSEFDGNANIFVIDNKGKKLKEIEVFIETYENDSKVEEIEIEGFKDVRKIVRVVVSQCACYCDTLKYYWLITNSDEWIELPIIEEADYELELKTKDYVFSEDKSNVFKIIEVQDEIIKNKENSTPVFKKKSEKILNTFIWNGTIVVEK